MRDCSASVKLGPYGYGVLPPWPGAFQWSCRVKVTETALPGVLLVEPRVFSDRRGYFFESYNAERYATAGVDAPFVQDNISCSSRGVLRGLHFQSPHGQGKLIQVLQGSVYDVAVDVRHG